jgi:hypothetical protein
MSDSYRCFNMIFSSLKSIFPSAPSGNLLRHLKSTAFLINGIIRSNRCNLPDVAAKCADARKPASREKSFYRLLKNPNFTYDTFYLPFAQALLHAVNTKYLAIVFDGSVVGNGCIALVAGLVYRNRSLPLCWLVRKGCKGHMEQEFHIELWQQLLTIVPADKTIIFFGDGEFDGSKFLHNISKNKHVFVARTAENRKMTTRDDIFKIRDLDVGAEEFIWVPKAKPFADSSFSCHAVVWWNRDYKEPIYLFTNLQPIEEALYWYKKRFTIETFFSDQKSRGFHIHKSHIAKPQRLQRLLIAAAVAYLFVIYFGIYATLHDFYKTIHRTERCDLSMFKLGQRFIDYLLGQAKYIPRMIQLELLYPDL